MGSILFAYYLNFWYEKIVQRSLVIFWPLDTNKYTLFSYLFIFDYEERLLIIVFLFVDSVKNCTS